MAEEINIYSNIRWEKVAFLPLKLFWLAITWFFRYPPTLSYGKVSTYLSCPIKYKFQYIDQIPIQSSRHLSFGNSLHKALEQFHRNYDCKTATDEQILGCLEKSWISDGYLSKEEEENHHNKARTMLKQYLIDNRNLTSTPQYFEKSINDKIGVYTIKARFDRVDKTPDGKFQVIDYKTGKTLDAKQLKKELQPKLYSILAGREWRGKFDKIVFYYLESGKKVTPEFSRDDFRQTIETVKDVGRSIYRKIFTPHASALCSWCDYQPICPEWKNRPSSKTLFRLSYSKMSSYKFCPRSYKFLYVDKVPPQPKSFFSIGIAVHNALEEFYQYDGYLKEPSLKWLLGLLKKHWMTAGFTSIEEEKKFYSEAKSLLETYYEHWIRGKFKKAFACEPYFELPVGTDFVIIGFIDRIEQLPDDTYEVIDYKTEPKIRTQQEVDEDLQLTIYYWACIKNLGITPSKVSLDFLRHDKRISTTRTQEDIDNLIQYISELGNKMRNEKEFLPKLNKYCMVCDHLVGCPLEQEARQKAKEEESYQKAIELVQDNQLVDLEKQEESE